MSRRAARWLLFAGLVVMVPVPVLLIGDPVIPVGRLLLLGGFAGLVVLREGMTGFVSILVPILLVHALVYGALFALAAAGLARLLARTLPPRGVAAVVVGALVLGAAATTLLEPYRTPYARRSIASNLVEAYR